MRGVKILFLVAAALLSLGAAAQELPDLTSFRLLRASGAVVSVAQAGDALKNYDVIFVGELHDHIGNHLAEMALLRELAARVPKLALSLEQFERDVQPVMDDY